MNNNIKTTEKLSITIDIEQHKELKQNRENNGIPISSQIRQALKQYFSNKGNR